MHQACLQATLGTNKGSAISSAFFSIYALITKDHTQEYVRLKGLVQFFQKAFFMKNHTHKN